MGTPKRHVISCKASPPTGPFSHAVQAGNLVFVSGIMGLDKETGNFAHGGTGEEFRLALKNLACILIDSGSGFDKLVKITIILDNLKDLCAVNSVYKEYFANEFPARTIYQAKLPMNAAVAIDAIALCGDVNRAPYKESGNCSRN